MQIPILVEQVANNGYRASSGAPLALSADGATRDEAVRNLESLVRQRLAAGAEIAVLDVAGAAKNSLAEFAGMFKDDPMFDDVVRIMEEIRKRDNADPDYL